MMKSRSFKPLFAGTLVCLVTLSSFARLPDPSTYGETQTEALQTAERNLDVRFSGFDKTAWQVILDVGTGQFQSTGDQTTPVFSKLQVARFVYIDSKSGCNERTGCYADVAGYFDLANTILLQPYHPIKGKLQMGQKSLNLSKFQSLLSNGVVQVVKTENNGFSVYFINDRLMSK